MIPVVIAIVCVLFVCGDEVDQTSLPRSVRCYLYRRAAHSQHHSQSRCRQVPPLPRGVVPLCPASRHCLDVCRCLVTYAALAIPRLAQPQRPVNVSIRRPNRYRRQVRGLLYHRRQRRSRHSRLSRADQRHQKQQCPLSLHATE